MPDTTPLAECPREDCTAILNHCHKAKDGDAYNCLRQLGGSCPTHDRGRAFATRCYAPRTQPAPDEDERIAAWAAIAGHPFFAPCYATAAPLLPSMLDRLDGLDAQPAPQPPAVVRLPDGWERGHDAKYWVETGLTPYGLTLDEERAPGVLNWLGVDYYRPESPLMPVAPPQPPAVVLPTVDEVADAILASSTTGEGWHVSGARAALDLIAGRVTPWQPVAPGTVIKAGTHHRIEWDGDDPSSAGWAFATERRSSFDFTPCPTDPGRYSIDPRTVPAPAEPEDPAEMFRDALIAVTGEPLRYLSSIGTDEMAAALNAAGLDLTPRADQ